MAHFGRCVALPAALVDRGFRLRGETEADYPFLEHLFATVRGPEFAAAPWTDEQRRLFLAQQFQLQYKHYSIHYHDADFGILERNGVPIGRLYLFRGRSDIRVVDVSLLPEHCGQGIGTALLQAVFAEGALEGRSVSVHVEHHNPARRLYERLGFQEVSRDGVYALMEWRAAVAS